MYPRTKIDGGGPGLKGIKRDKSGGPGYYNLNYKRVEKRSLANKFMVGENKNFVTSYVKSKAAIPGVGRYKDVENGIRATSRPLSSGGRRRIT